jgi:hypothetical protein
MNSAPAIYRLSPEERAILIRTIAAVALAKAVQPDQPSRISNSPTEPTARPAV